MKKIVRKVRHKRSLGAASNLENDGFVLREPWFTHFRLVRGSFVGPPPRSPLESKSANNRKQVVPRSKSKNTVFKVLRKRSLGTPSNIQNNGFFFTRNHCLHISICTSKTMQIQWVLLWHPFRWFWGSLGNIWVDKKSIEQIIKKVVCGSCRGLLGAGSGVP